MLAVSLSRIARRLPKLKMPMPKTPKVNRGGFKKPRGRADAMNIVIKPVKPPITKVQATKPHYPQVRAEDLK